MKATDSHWALVSRCFDELAELDASTRRQRLDSMRLDDEALALLEALLDAHDSPEPLVIDRTLHVITSSAYGGDGVAPPSDWSGVQLGHWRIRSEVQRGGMATVVRAERADGQYERQVAIKVLHTTRTRPEHATGLERELKLMAGLAHPGIVHMIDGGISEQGWPFLVMEYVEGLPIDRWCEEHAASIETRVALVREVAVAVAHAHGRLVVHADLKPGNVLVDGDGRVRLVDFGIGALLGDSDESDPTAGLSCSPSWAAPEQLEGKPPTVATDVFGLGMLLIALLSDSPPRTPRESARALAGQRPPPAPAPPSATPVANLPVRRIRGDLDAICRRATDADPALRYPSAEAFERDLAAWQARQPVAARQGGFAYRAGRWLSRHSLPVAAATLIAVALVVGITLASWQAQRAQAEAQRATAQAERAETIKEFLLSMFKAADPWLTGSQALDVQDLLAQGIQQALNDQSLEPDTRVELLITLGDVQVALGEHEAAEALFSEAESLLDQSSEMDPTWRIRLLLERAGLSSAQRNPQVTERQLDEARAILDAYPDRIDRLLRVRLARDYASLYARQNREVDAERVFDQLEDLLAQPGDDLIEYRQLLLGSRAVLAYNRGRVEEARRWALAELDLLRRMEPQRGPAMISTLSSLAATSAQLGELEAALDYDRQAMELARTIYPNDHPGVATALYAYGDTLRQLGRYEEALDHLDQARRIRVDRGLNVGVALVDMVRTRTLLALGRGAEAATLVAGARSTLEAAWGPDGRTILQALDFELQAAYITDRWYEIDRLDAIAADRLAGLSNEDRWQPLAQMLRWRIARIRYDGGQAEQARAWLQDAAQRPEGVIRHASVELRLLGLSLLANGNPAHSSAELAEEIAAHANDPAANADSKAFAWCALLTSKAVKDPERVEAQLATLADQASLSQEGRRDVECALARPSTG